MIRDSRLLHLTFRTGERVSERQQTTTGASCMAAGQASHSCLRKQSGAIHTKTSPHKGSREQQCNDQALPTIAGHTFSPHLQVVLLAGLQRPVVIGAVVSPGFATACGASASAGVTVALEGPSPEQLD